LARGAQLEEARALLRLKVPGLRKSVGAGDVVRMATKAVGIDPCGGCEERRARLNRFLEFQSYLEEQT
jgi:hypothetical protein